MSANAKGSFTVNMEPLGEANSVEGVALGRMSLKKQFELMVAADRARTGVLPASSAVARTEPGVCRY